MVYDDAVQGDPNFTPPYLETTPAVEERFQLSVVDRWMISTDYFCEEPEKEPYILSPISVWRVI